MIQMLLSLIDAALGFVNNMRQRNSSSSYKKRELAQMDKRVREYNGGPLFEITLDFCISIGGTWNLLAICLQCSSSRMEYNQGLHTVL